MYIPILAIASTAYHWPIATDLPAAAHLRPRHCFVSHSGGDHSFPCRLWASLNRKLQLAYNSNFLPISHRNQPEHAEGPMLSLFFCGLQSILTNRLHFFWTISPYTFPCGRTFARSKHASSIPRRYTMTGRSRTQPQQLGTWVRPSVHDDRRMQTQRREK